MKYSKKELLKQKIKHIDIKKFDSVPLIESFDDMAFQSRNLARACKIYDQMLKDSNCSIILCLAGSLVSAGLKKVIIDLIKHNMVDCIVSTGAIVVDQDFFEGLGFNHYRGFVNADDNQLRKLMIDRIYDTFIDEEDLRVCDMTTKKIADTMKPGAYSSIEWENIWIKMVKLNLLFMKRIKNKSQFSALHFLIVVPALVSFFIRLKRKQKVFQSIVLQISVN